MTSYIALLRGINVGGHRPVPMADLRELCEALGFERVATYIQSGNVVFASDATPDAVQRRIEAAIAERFGFPVDVAVRTHAELAAVAADHPLAPPGPNEAFLHVFFLGGDPDPERVTALDPGRFAPDEMLLRGRELYVHYANGAGRSKLAFDFGVPATARNWRTVRALLTVTAALE
ncbi:MAG: DUF1697 domain-containing protein [Chloroflexi bacterium]|nr:DUF1697 domain-containing protein [Chloroflexota bacterium]MDA1004278.1 DUF1697 domain-containing protein [Chloroflexota bacterium]